MTRNKNLEIAVCETAEFDIASYPVPASFLTLVERSFVANIVDKDRDVSDGSLRFRSFGAWIVTFLISESADAVHLSVLRVAMPEDVSASQRVLERLLEIAKLHSASVKGLEIAVKGKA